MRYVRLVMAKPLRLIDYLLIGVALVCFAALLISPVRIALPALIFMFFGTYLLQAWVNSPKQNSGIRVQEVSSQSPKSRLRR